LEISLPLTNHRKVISNTHPPTTSERPEPPHHLVPFILSSFQPSLRSPHLRLLEHFLKPAEIEYVIRQSGARHLLMLDAFRKLRLPEMLAPARIGLVPNLPSSATHLMLPVKMLDYATLGIPVIASRLRTVERYFGDGAVEFFEPGNAEDLARAIERLYLDADLRAQLVSHGRRAIERLSWDAQRAEYLNVIDSLMTDPSRYRAFRLKQERL